MCVERTAYTKRPSACASRSRTACQQASGSSAARFLSEMVVVFMVFSPASRIQYATNAVYLVLALKLFSCCRIFQDEVLQRDPELAVGMTMGKAEGLPVRARGGSRLAAGCAVGDHPVCGQAATLESRTGCAIVCPAACLWRHWKSAVRCSINNTGT